MLERGVEHFPLRVRERGPNRDLHRFTLIGTRDRPLPNGLQVERDEVVAEHEAALDAVPKLADVAGPAMRSRDRESSRVEAFARAVLAIQAFEEGARMQLDIVSSSPQRRKANDEYRETIEEVFA